MSTVPSWLVIEHLAAMLLFLTLAACQAADRPTPTFAMNVTEMFPDPQVRALATAAARGDVERVSLLVQQGLNVDSEGVRGITPLFWAMQRLNRAGYKRLLELGANPNHRWTNGASVIYYAPQVADLYYLEQALLHGGDPIGTGLAVGWNPLFSAVTSSTSHPDSVRMLIEAGADVNMTDEGVGFTPLMRAAISSRHDLIYLLLGAGADPSIKAVGGSTFIDVFERNRGRESRIPGMSEWREKVIELLRERGYDVE